MGWMATIRPFQGFERLFEMRERDHKAFRAAVEFGSSQPYAALRGDEHPLGVRARWAMGKRVPDGIVHATFPPVVLLSKPLVEALRNRACTGWSAYDVALVGKHGEDVGTYVGLIVTGRCGRIKYGSQGRIMKRMPGGESPHLVGLAFDEASWDGSDIFMSPNRASIFVTEAARDAVLSAARSVSFQPLSQVEVPERYASLHDGPPKVETN